MKKFLVVVLLLAVVIGLAGSYLGISFLKTTPNSQGQEIIFEVSPGESFIGVASRLKEQGLITDEKAFYVYAKLRKMTASLKTGEYALNTALLPKEVLAIITSGKSIMRPFTVPEGRNIYEISKAYEDQKLGSRAEFLKAVQDSKFASQLVGYRVSSLEGYLYPETYQITRFTSTRDLIKKMVERFQLVYKETIGDAVLPGFTKHQIVTFASIVEKETGAPEERPLIASVFHNRMKKNMRLQTDPTVLYGKWDITGDLSMNITKQDLLTPNRYNTYTLRGLPYGPIANPGREALLATIKPATSNYLFFVSRNNGTHIFSENYKDHAKAVRDFQMNPKAREGKSWRDRNK